MTNKSQIYNINSEKKHGLIIKNNPCKSDIGRMKIYLV